MAQSASTSTDKRHKSTNEKNHLKKRFPSTKINPSQKDSQFDLQSKYNNIDEDSIKMFSDFPLSHETLKGLKEYKYKIPTQIQKQSIGLALQGKDILGAAQTGSGKTLAFLIPVLEKLYCEKWNRIYGLGALIITPTRELAKQIFQTLLEIGKYHDFSGGLIIGGKDRKFEIKRMDQCNIIICTPGRLLDHMDKNPLFDCSNMQILVLDEADRCLDMGFETQMNQIIDNLPPERQTLLFSATQTKSVRDLGRLSLKDPSYVSVHEHLEHSTPQGLKQSYAVCDLKDKISIIWSFIRNHLKQKIIIFYSTCKQVKYMFEIFSKLRPGTSLMALYGTLHQLRRMNIYDSFCKKSTGVLLATDLAARGLDFPGVHWVVQADCPEDSTMYIHRVGRTARYHKGGEALLLLLPSEVKIVDKLNERKIPIEKIEINPLKLSNPVKKMEAYLSGNNTLKDSAQRAFISYVKAVALMKDKSVFNVEALDTDSFAHSIGLLKPPRIRFLQRRKMKSASNTHNTGDNQLTEKSYISETVDDKGGSDDNDDNFSRNDSQSRPAQLHTSQGYVSEDDDNESLELWEMRRRDHNIEPPTETESKKTKMNESKKSKPVSKAALAKKLFKKHALPNKKIIFTDDGEEVTKGYYNEKKSNIALEYENETVGGIDLEKAREVLREEDRFDKQLFKEKVKAKHKEEKRKLKEAKKKLDENEDIEFSEDEEPDMSWLPSPDEVYCKLDDADCDNTQQNSDMEDYVPALSKSTKMFKKRKQGPDSEVETKSKKKKRNNHIENVSKDLSEVETKSKKKKRNNHIENVSKDLSINEAEELALLLLKNKT